MPALISRRGWAFGLGLALLGAAAVARAQDAKPARPDSRLKPPEVKLSSSIEPARARPGETVELTVTAKVAKGWHIYEFVAAQPAQGPRGTQFEVFDPAGLKPEGDWKSSKEPIRKPEPAFPDLAAVEYFEDEASWSIRLKVPADAKPGKRSVQTQVYFQICDAKSCKPPARVTAPPATVEVVAGGGGGGMAALIGGAMIAATPTVEAAPPATAPPANEVQASIDRGLPAFLLLSALHGLLAVLMPCVWPMIPITVNFFVKQGQSKQGGRATGLALAYCLAIIGIFTLIGMVFAAAFGASSTTKLGNDYRVNFLFAAVFIAFGLSLLGVFEIRLPSFLLNASAQGEGRGGLVGVMFMAMTLTITSFTCTAPLVGSLLVMASRGQFFYPVVGLVTFSAVLSLPFFVLALVPSLMTSLPRSGDWMNAVKVVGGLLEIGAAFKFLNTAEVSLHGGRATEAIFDAQVIVAIWVVILLVCGIYLLGLFRTDHDHDAVKVGPGRLLTGTVFLCAALYLAPALFGVPPKGKVYETIAGILPPDANELEAGHAAPLGGPALAGTPAGAVGLPQAVAAEADRPVAATSTDPKVAIREERTVHGVSWGLSFEQALEQAKATGKPVLVDFTGVNCANCRTMERTIMPRPEVVTLMRHFVTVQQYTDFVPIKSLTAEQTEELAEINLEREDKLTGQTTSPLYAIVDADGKLIATTAYDPDPSVFVRFLKSGLEKFQDGAPKVARSN